MKDEERTREELLGELAEMRRRLSSLEASEERRRRAEETLREAHKELQEAKRYIESSPDAIVSTDKNRNITFFSPGAEALLGYRREEVIGRRVSMLYEDEEQAKEVMRRMRAGGGTVAGFEMTARAKDGSLIPALISASILYDEEGQEVGTVGFSKDLRERKRAEQALQESEERYRSVAQSAVDAIISADSRGEIISWNTGAQTIFGYEEEEVLGKPLALLMPERFREVHRKGLERMSRTGEPRGAVKAMELHGLRKDGTEFPMALSLGTWSKGDEHFYSGIIRDVTEQRRAEEALRESEEKYRKLIENMNDGLAIVDEKGVVTYVNRKLCEMFGYSQDEMVGQPATRFLDEVNLKLFQEQLARRRKGEREPYEIEWIRKDGRRICTITSPEPIILPDGRFQGSFGILTDITERKRAEETMRIANEQMRQQLESARIIQQSFLPGRLPGADDSRFRLGALNHPADAVGGDYYDVIPMGGSRLGLVIGDVAGKGVPGAIYMARLVSDFRFLVDPIGGSPAETLTALNHLLLGRGQPGMFVTLLYLTLDVDTGVATYANAGHLPFLLRRGRGTIDTLDGPAGPPLGIVEETVYDNAEVALMPGEDLLLFTDGVTEAMNSAREQFSHDRLVEVLRRAPTGPDALVAAVAEAVRSFAAGAPVHDDLTLLAARWEG